MASDVNVYRTDVSRRCARKFNQLSKLARLGLEIDHKIELLNCPENYTGEEYNRLASEYRGLLHQYDALEENIKKEYPGVDTQKEIDRITNR